MFWIFLALLAHVANGAVFIVDKSLLGGKSTFGKPLHYALYSAALAICTLVLLPFAQFTPTLFIFTWSVVAGLMHIVALLVFFTAMRFGEPSRIVPITGSAVPLFTILFAVLFLGEVFTLWQGLGMVLLIVGGALLAGVSSIRSRMTLPLSLLAGALFAIYFVVTKYIYTYAGNEFLSVFMTTRVIEGLIALCGVAIFIGISFPLFKKNAVQRTHKGGISLIFVSNKVLAAGAFLLQTYAISLGSVSVVNALQGVQFAIVFLFAIFISRFFPKLFVEETSRDALLQKITGMILLSFGVALLVL